LFYQAFTRGQGFMRALLNSAGQVYSNTLFLVNLFAFLDLKPSVSDPPLPSPVPERLSGGISFERVTFNYPGSEQPALEDFSLSLSAGRIAAIVGPNGAGKTTLLKLLCRFYDPQGGCVKIDGTDIREFSVADLRRALTVLFQVPLNYCASAAESIALGNLGSFDNHGIEDAARRAGAHDFISKLPFGYETLLGKWFPGGAELSGGEWQKIAMARAYVRQSQIVLLDEPTSFMDSWAEADWFERFRAMVTGRTGVIVTHRFTIAMRADVIHVMNDGKVVESGCHHELLARGGLYAQSWRAQLQATLTPA
jgi:ATP-binding cassette subfamily B protein